MHSQINFAYPWYLFWGHLLIALPFLALAWFVRKRWMRVLSLSVVAWALSAWMIIQFGFGVNRKASLPTEAFLSSGSGRVLDLGAGTGRSAIMVLEARPQTTLVALDEFGGSFQQHFGDGGRSLLEANLKAAGVDQRATITKADMREIPFEPNSFDALVSAYAIDHLGRRGIEQTLAEAFRVLKPGGQFLFIVTNADLWLKYAMGPLMAHAHMRGLDDWRPLLRAAGFTLGEEGSRVATVYVLCQKPAMAP